MVLPPCAPLAPRATGFVFQLGPAAPTTASSLAGGAAGADDASVGQVGRARRSRLGPSATRHAGWQAHRAGLLSAGGIGARSTQRLPVPTDGCRCIPQCQDPASPPPQVGWEDESEAGEEELAYAPLALGSAADCLPDFLKVRPAPWGGGMWARVSWRAGAVCPRRSSSSWGLAWRADSHNAPAAPITCCPPPAWAMTGAAGGHRVCRGPEGAACQNHL